MIRTGPVLAITGPTASGKTGVSIPVALRLGGEIISMDSRQVYRGMDVGTDKVRPTQRGRIPHHGLDLVDPTERYSAGRWARETRRWIEEIQGRGRVPILVGGTGFFLRALSTPLFQQPPLDPDRRRRLEAWLEGLDRDELARWSRVLDPSRAETAGEGGRHRLMRSIEVALLTGRPLSWWHANAPPEADAVELRIVLLTLPRDVLYRRIDERVVSMFRRDGLLEEVRSLLAAGASPRDPGMTGTGYREAAAVLSGELTEEEAIDRVQRATRAYARRQLTWFRHQLPREGRLELDATRPTAALVAEIVEWWEGIGGAGRG